MSVLVFRNPAVTPSRSPAAKGRGWPRMSNRVWLRYRCRISTGWLRPPGETVSCVSSMFSWATLDDQRQLFYQIEIRGAEGRHVYRSPYGQGISCVRVPPDVLQPDRKYQWRVRVADSGDWIKVNNRAQSWWVTFKTTETLDRCGYEYRVPEADADWRTSSLEAQGVDQQRLEELVGLISSNRIKKIHGVLLFKNGYLVLEEYFAGYHRDRKHLLISATKSFTSTLLGIARDKGFDIDPARKLAAYLPEYKDLLANGPKSGIILKDLLTMRAGLEWDEWTTPSSCLLMYQSSDPIRYVLKQKLVDQPGRNFLYSTGLSTVLGRVLENSTGMTVDEFARQHLFTPLGITDWFLKKLPDGTAMTGGNLYLRPRDMAKLGYLFLRDGVWNGRRIVSRDWIRESIQPHVRGDLVSGTGYGYQWWRGSTRIGGREIDSFYAAGHGGQFVFVIPEENLIAVITSETDDNNAGDFRGYNILESYILPAVFRCNPDFALPARKVDSHPRITGRYHWAKAKLPLKIFADQGKLYGQTVIFAGRFRMFPIDKGRFLCVSDDVGNFWLDTKEDSEGKITGIKLTIGFSNLTFEKTTWPF